MPYCRKLFSRRRLFCQEKKKNEIRLLSFNKFLPNFANGGLWNIAVKKIAERMGYSKVSDVFFLSKIYYKRVYIGICVQKY